MAQREVPSDAGRVGEKSLKRPAHNPLRAQLREQALSPAAPVAPEQRTTRRREFEEELSLFGNPNRIDTQIKAGIETHDLRAAKKRRLKETQEAEPSSSTNTPQVLGSDKGKDKDRGGHTGPSVEGSQSSDQWVYSGKIGTLSQVKRIYKGDIRAISDTTTELEVVNALDELRNMAVKKGYLENNESFIRKWDEKAHNGSINLQKLMRRLANHADAELQA